MSIEVIVSGKILKRFKNLKQGIEKVAPSITNKAGNMLYDGIVSEIRSVGAVASEDLINSVDLRLEYSSDDYLLEVGSSAPQAYWVELGRKASGKMPPYDAIYKWMLDKGLNGTIQDAFKIAKYLQYNDTPARRPFKTALEKTLPKIEKYIGKAVDQIVRVK